MSVRALTWSFNLELRDVTAKSVLHALADHADEEGRCWPSIERIARYAGCGERTAQRAIQRIVALGIVKRESRSGRTDIFCLNFGWNPRQSDTPVKSAPVSLDTEPPSERHPTPVNLTPHPRQSDTRTVKEPSLNPQGNRQCEREAFSLYNEACDGKPWPRAQRFNETRASNLKRRLSECDGLDGWRMALAKARASPFLSSAGWFSLDWMLKPANFTKIMEGNYDARSDADISANRSDTAAFMRAAARLGGREPLR